MDKVPVFDIGDTVSDSRKLIKEAVRKEMARCGIEKEKMPEFPMYEYNIYREADLERFAEERNLEGFDSERVQDTFQRMEDRNFVVSGAVEVLKMMNSEVGPIGIVSDNSEEAKEVWKQRLSNHGIEYNGFIVSDSVGHVKPDKEIFQAFENELDADGYVYFGNHAEKDSASEKIGWSYVQVAVFDTFGTYWSGRRITEMKPELFLKAFREVSE